MAEFLTEAWFEALAAALGSLSTTGTRAGGPGGLALGQVVTGVPDKAGVAGVQDGEVRYTLLLRPDGPASLVRGSTERAEVTLVADWSTAEAVASGTASVPDMLSAGRIKLRGDTRALVSAGDFLAAIAPLVATALAGAQTN
ncbi:MAG: hypothetical protein ACLP36_04305 [Acidimicrobiales bacterium]